MDNFTKSLKLTLEHEGGFVDHPHDPGGATNKGTTLKTFKRAFGDEMSVDDLRDITMTDIESMVKPDGILDDLRWEPMVLVNRLECTHHVIIHNGELTYQHPIATKDSTFGLGWQ